MNPVLLIPIRLNNEKNAEALIMKLQKVTEHTQRCPPGGTGGHLSFIQYSAVYNEIRLTFIISGASLDLKKKNHDDITY